MAFVVSGTCTSNNIGTVRKHFFALSNSSGSPVAAYIYFRYIVTAIEHPTHVLHLSGVEIRKVELMQTVTLIEHAAHVCYIGCIESANINKLQYITIMEHILHVCYALGLKVIHASNG